MVTRERYARLGEDGAASLEDWGWRVRLAGCVLLIGGFLWLTWDVLSIGPIARVAVEMQRGELEADRDTTYTRGQVINGMGVVIADFLRRLPNFILPGCAMFLGGSLLAYRRRGGALASPRGVR
jgi:hypothetical protein